MRIRGEYKRMPTISFTRVLAGCKVRKDALLALLLTGFFTATFLAPTLIRPWSGFGLCLVAGIGWRWQIKPVMHLALFGACWCFGLWYLPDSWLWLFKLVMIVVTFSVLVWITQGIQEIANWIQPGRLDSGTWKLLGLTIGISMVALIGWKILFRPDLSVPLKMMPRIPWWLYPVAGLGFALVNAAIEEFIFRGVLFGVLERTLGRGYVSLGLQAISFGVLHFRAGFPNGVAGLVMVTVYGVMLGLIRRQSRGMLGPWMAHVLADITIFSLLVILLALGSARI